MSDDYPTKALWEALGRWTGEIGHDHPTVELAPPTYVVEATKALDAEIERLRAALTEITNWLDVYPTSGGVAYNLARRALGGEEGERE